MGAINSGYIAPSGGCHISSLVATDWSSYYYNCPGLTCAAGYSPIYSDAPYLYCDTWNMTYEYYGCECMSMNSTGFLFLVVYVDVDVLFLIHNRNGLLSIEDNSSRFF